MSPPDLFVLAHRRQCVRRWAAFTLLLAAFAAVLYVTVLGSLVDGFLQRADLPCEPFCLNVARADLADVRTLLLEHGRYAAAYDLYFPRVLLIDLCVVALVGIALGVRGREGAVNVSATRFGGAAILVLMVGSQLIFWEAINVATLVTE